MGRPVWRGATALTLMLAITGCATPSDEPKNPGERYSSIEQLAEALEGAGLCDDFKDLRPNGKLEFGRCRSKPEEPPGGTLILQFMVFSDDQEYEKHKRWASSGCSGPHMFGPNWYVSALGFGTIPRVEDAVGGEIVGFHEKDC